MEQQDVVGSLIEALGEVSSGAGNLGDAIVQMNLGNQEASGLDLGTYVLVRFAALAAVDAPLASYATVLELGREAGATPEQAAGVLIALAPVIGGARVTSAAGKLQQAFEQLT